MNTAGVSLAGIRMSGVLLVCALLSSPTATVASAQSPRPVRSRIMVAGSPSGSANANACAELASSPSPLVQVPEGLALLRLKRELESATQMIEMSQPMQREQVKQLSQVQRGVDSAMQVVVRFYGRDGGPREVVTIRNGDSARLMANGRVLDTREIFLTMDSTMRRVAPMIAGEMVRALYPQVAAFAEEAESHLPDRGAAAAGYVGVSLSGAQIRIVSPDGVLTSHCEYPMVESVDAGSPAERAGLVAGDTLLAYNGRDVTLQAINYPAMLVPGTTVRFRLRRNGRARDAAVGVVPRRDDRLVVELRGSGAGGRPPEATFNTRLMVSGAAMPTPPAPPSAATNLMLSGTGIAVLAGAQFSTIDEEFASSANVSAGVLVLRVPPGTPAADAGLRAGEVVLTANGVRVRDVAALRRALTGTSRDVRLVVQSKSAGERTVVLRLR